MRSLENLVMKKKKSNSQAVSDSVAYKIEEFSIEFSFRKILNFENSKIILYYDRKLYNDLNTATSFIARLFHEI
jgi:hypothetical protein